MSILLQSLIPLASTALGGAIGYWSAAGLAKRNAYRPAGNDLRAAFAPELAKVRTTPHEFWGLLETISDRKVVPLNEILSAAFDRHAIAIEKYRFFVPPSKLAAYDAAWQYYYMEGKKKGFFHYEHDEAGKEDFLRNVAAIFRFTADDPVWAAGVAARVVAWFRGAKLLPRQQGR